MEINLDELKSGKLEGTIGSFAFFSKELIMAVGKEKIVMLANPKINGSVHEYLNGSVRIIRHLYGKEKA